jgi:hypothetical protein
MFQGTELFLYVSISTHIIIKVLTTLPWRRPTGAIQEREKDIHSRIHSHGTKSHRSRDYSKCPDNSPLNGRVHRALTAICWCVDGTFWHSDKSKAATTCALLHGSSQFSSLCAGAYGCQEMTSSSMGSPPIISSCFGHIQINLQSSYSKSEGELESLYVWMARSDVVICPIFSFPFSFLDFLPCTLVLLILIY